MTTVTWVENSCWVEEVRWKSQRNLLQGDVWTLDEVCKFLQFACYPTKIRDEGCHQGKCHAVYTRVELITGKYKANISNSLPHA